MRVLGGMEANRQSGETLSTFVAVHAPSVVPAASPATTPALPIEDDAGDALLVREYLLDTDQSFSVVWRESPPEAVSILRTGVQGSCWAWAGPDGQRLDPLPRRPLPRPALPAAPPAPAPLSADMADR